MNVTRPTNNENDYASGPSFGIRKSSMPVDRSVGSQMKMQEAYYKTGGRESPQKALDLTAYRGNLFKQTLSPQWSKTQLRQAQQKYAKISDEVRRSIGNISDLSNKVSPR